MLDNYSMHLPRVSPPDSDILAPFTRYDWMRNMIKQKVPNSCHMFRDVEYLLWDVDGTLYKSDPSLVREIRQQTYIRISKELAVDVEKAKESFSKWYHAMGGATAAVTRMGLSRQLILDAVDAVDKTTYIRRDDRLRHMLEDSLSGYKHIIVTNTSRRGTLRTLEILGLKPGLFKALITADDVVHSKPDTEPFVKALNVTGAPPSTHLSIGDRESVDIVPAKKLGIRTALVWGESKSADCSLPSIYDLERILCPITGI